MLTKKEYKTIRAQLLMLDISFAQIARKFYVSREMVSLSVRGKRDSDLAREIRVYVDELLSDKEADVN